MTNKISLPTRRVTGPKLNKWYEPYLLLTPMLIMMSALFLYPIVLSLCMLIGRLEVFPVLMLVSPTAWRR